MNIRAEPSLGKVDRIKVSDILEDNLNVDMDVEPLHTCEEQQRQELSFSMLKATLLTLGPENESRASATTCSSNQDVLAYSAIDSKPQIPQREGKKQDRDTLNATGQKRQRKQALSRPPSSFTEEKATALYNRQLAQRERHMKELDALRDQMEFKRISFSFEPEITASQSCVRGMSNIDAHLSPVAIVPFSFSGMSEERFVTRLSKGRLLEEERQTLMDTILRGKVVRRSMPEYERVPKPLAQPSNVLKSLGRPCQATDIDTACRLAEWEQYFSSKK